jgi:hypothetical protein
VVPLSGPLQEGLEGLLQRVFGQGNIPAGCRTSRRKIDHSSVIFGGKRRPAAKRRRAIERRIEPIFIAQIHEQTVGAVVEGVLKEIIVAPE